MDDAEFASTSEHVYTAIVYACVLAVQLRIIVVRKGNKWGLGTLSKEKRGSVTVTRQGLFGDHVLTLRDWRRGSVVGQAVLLQLLLFVWSGDTTYLGNMLGCPLLATAGDARVHSLDFCEDCVRQGNHVSLLCFLLNRMIEFAPALEMALVTWDFLLPLDWIVPIAGGKKNGLITLVWSMGSKLEIPADNPPEDMREMYVWSIVCTAIKAIPDGVAMMQSGAEGKWGTIGRARSKVVDRVYKTIWFNSRHYERVCNHVSYDEVSKEQVKQMKKGL